MKLKKMGWVLLLAATQAACGGSAQTEQSDKGGAGSSGASEAGHVERGGSGNGEAGGNRAGSNQAGSGGALVPPALDEDTCIYDGSFVFFGQTFPAGDACNTCMCMTSHLVECTQRACACDPEREYNRHYVLQSAEQCAVADYACDGKTKAFSNECGCGCEQAANCPEVLSCTAGSEYCDKQQAECPLSKTTE